MSRSMKAAERQRLIDEGIRHAREDVERDPLLVTSLSRITINDGMFRFDDSTFLTIHVIMLECGVERIYRESEDYTQRPDCFALSTGDAHGMRPHRRSRSPQCHSCDLCRWNQFHTANGGRGKGKRCIENQRVILLTEDKEVRFLRIPPTSLKAFREYRTWLKLRGLKLYNVITRVGLQPEKLYPVLTFKYVVRVLEHREALEKIRRESSELLLSPY